MDKKTQRLWGISFSIAALLAAIQAPSSAHAVPWQYVPQKPQPVLSGPQKPGLVVPGAGAAKTALPGQGSYGQQRRVNPTYNSYYGEAFYRAMQSNSKEMKAIVREVLVSDHRMVPGKYDEISRDCSGQGCYSRRSLGYEQARIFLMGYYYLVKSSQGYGVREVYCDRVYEAREFPNEKPAPKQIPDDTIVNTEHTWPQSMFSGRYSKELQKSDLHHLFPTDSRMNSTRSSYQFGVVQDSSGKLKCTASKFGRAAGYNGPVFEPPTRHKGNVARALFYFSTHYETNISQAEERTLREWNKQDPVDDEEMNRNNEIYKVQGNRNPFIDHPELADRMADF